MTITIKKLQSRIISLRNENPPVKWRVICEAFGILKDNGLPDTGLASIIAYKDFDPTRMELRKRLNLSTVCPSCKRTIKKYNEHNHNATSVQPPSIKWWKSLSPIDRARHIQNLFELETGG